jgi:CheY-like chemotaxis protein
MRKIFVKCFGFSDTERHALNTALRLSEARDTVYAEWTSGTAKAAKVLLIDGDSWETVVALANPLHDGVRMIWIGEKPPKRAWRVFPAPVIWSSVVEAMDREFAPPTSLSMSRDLDFEFDPDIEVDPEELENTEPAPLAAENPAAGVSKRVLVVDAGRPERLYLRAKLAAAGFYLVDDAPNTEEALDFLNTHEYQLVIIDLDLPNMASQQLIRLIATRHAQIPHLFVSGPARSWHQVLRARWSETPVYLTKPFQPEQINRALKKLQPLASRPVHKTTREKR